MFRRDVAGGWAWFSAERGRGACGAVACGSLCVMCCHCDLGLERAARLGARRAEDRGFIHHLVNPKKEVAENGSQN